MAAINPYLLFDGTCEQAFLFYKSVFGGEFPYMGRFGEMPPMDGQSINPKDANLIMHVSLPISKETVLMGSDFPESQGPVNYGNNFSISVNTNKGRSRYHFQRAFSSRTNYATDAPIVLGRVFRDVYQQIRCQLDGQFRCESEMIN